MASARESYQKAIANKRDDQSLALLELKLADIPLQKNLTDMLIRRLMKRKAIINMPRTRIVISLAMAIFVVSGCSWFGDENEPVEIKPNPLPKIKPEVSISTVWSKKIGQGAKRKSSTY